MVPQCMIGKIGNMHTIYLAEGWGGKSKQGGRVINEGKDGGEGQRKSMPEPIALPNMLERILVM